MAGFALPIQSPTGGTPQFNAKQNREVDSSLLLGRVGSPLGSVSGIRPGADPAVTINSARQWVMPPTTGTIDAGSSSVYRFAFESGETGQLDPPDTSYLRYDRLDIQVPDETATTGLAAVCVVTKGTPNNQPTVPDAPPRTLQIGVFTVPTQGNPSFAPTYPYCAANGGIVPARNASARPTNPYRGQYIDDPTLGLLRFDGNGWYGPVAAPMFCGLSSGTQTVGPKTDSGVQLTSEDVNTSGGHAAGSSSYYAPLGGVYLLTGQVSFAIGSGRVGVTFAVNGKLQDTERVMTPAASPAAIVGASRSRLVRLNAGDQVQMMAYQSDTQALPLYYGEFSAAWLRS